MGGDEELGDVGMERLLGALEWQTAEGLGSVPRLWQLSSGIPLLGNCSFLTYQCSTWNLLSCFEIIFLFQPPFTSKDISIESTSWEWASTPI